ncbi:MAG: hypothetical protein LBG43_07435 [Treponema sp.]|nr:hypothetical protein [Treponema sp.]
MDQRSDCHPCRDKKPILEKLDKMSLNEGFFHPDSEHVSNVVCGAMATGGCRPDLAERLRGMGC